MSLNEWSPPYILRKSQRAKRISLQISLKHGLVVVVPEKKRHFNIQEIFLNKRAWIEKNLSHLKSIQANQTEESILPSVLSLHAIQKIIKLEYIKTANTHIKIKINNSLFHEPTAVDSSENMFCEHKKENSLVPCIEYYQVKGPIENKALVIKALKKFLTKIAELHLVPWLQQLSLITGLSFSGVSLRRQSTVWGSCSAAHKISLNVKLLFLPNVLVRYVLLHELCHTQHLNHSKRYWSLLKQFDPDYAHHKSALRVSAQYLPTWVE